LEPTQISRNAQALAEALGLPGEQWSILAALGEVYRATGAERRAQQAFKRAEEIIQVLAAGIEDETLRANFLAGAPVRRVLEAAS
jgi:hypothetical protein